MELLELKNCHCRFASTFVLSPLNKWLGMIQKQFRQGLEKRQENLWLPVVEVKRKKHK
jgi:hypothetical protein